MLHSELLSKKKINHAGTLYIPHNAGTPTYTCTHPHRVREKTSGEENSKTLTYAYAIVLIISNSKAMKHMNELHC